MSAKDDSKMVLKFRAIKEKLDWQGNVIEEVKEKDYDWDDYDPQLFLNSVIREGDLSSVPKPGNGEDPIEFFRKVFNSDYSLGWNNWEIFVKYRTIESIPINGNKFVIYDRASKRKMYWTSED